MSDRRFENHPALRAARVGPSRGGAQGSESASTIRDLTVAAPLKRVDFQARDGSAPLSFTSTRLSAT